CDKPRWHRHHPIGRAFVPRPRRDPAEPGMGAYAQRIAPGNFRQSDSRRFAGACDSPHLAVLQPAERRAAQCDGHQTADMYLPRSSDYRSRAVHPLLIVRDLKKHFPAKGSFWSLSRDTVQAVDGVSFSVAKGQTVGVVGESGCGKSTTARLLLHLIEPDAGEVIFDGEGVGAPGGIDVRDLRLRMQMVFQDSYSSLNPRATIADIIAFGPRTAKKVPPRQARDRAE